MATAPHGARLAVGSLPGLLRGHVNCLARLAPTASRGRGSPHGRLATTGGPADFLHRIAMPILTLHCLAQAGR